MPRKKEGFEVKVVSYSKVFALSGYQNEKIGCEIDVDSSQSPEEALEFARMFVEKQSTDHLAIKERFQRQIDNPDNSSVGNLRAAVKFMVNWGYEVPANLRSLINDN